MLALRLLHRLSAEQVRPLIVRAEVDIARRELLPRPGKRIDHFLPVLAETVLAAVERVTATAALLIGEEMQVFIL